MKRIIPILPLVILATSINAQLRLPRLFSDHMVLQRDQPVHIYGWATPEKPVEVTIGGFMIRTLPARNGTWELLYPAHSAGGPLDMMVRQGTDTLNVDDLWFGDVWVAGGQSNMEWELAWNVDNFEQEMADGDYPQIRFFMVPKEMAVTPQQELHGGQWIPASPQSVGQFSAVAWFFAKNNHLDKQVPVGIISSNWGGTPAEAWTSARRLLEVPGYKKAAAEMLDTAIDWQARMEENEARNARKWELINDKKTFLKSGAQEPDFDDSGWQEIILPNQEPLHDFAWLRKEVTLHSRHNVRFYLGDINQICQIFFNGRMVAEESWQDTTSIIDVPADVVRKGRNVIAVRAVNSWDNNVYAGKPGNMWIEAGKDRSTLEGVWKYSNTIEPKMPEVEFFNWRPGILYNQMIAPITGYSILGAIWYQGESNADKPQYYNELFETMIEDWRIHWKEGNFPFLFVQLANYMARKDQPSESQWAELREAQTQTLELPETGMATIIDIGEAEDIHPKNKQDVGKRLWLAAKHTAYDDKDTVTSGPVYQSHRTDGHQLTVTFDTQGSSLAVHGDHPVGFALAGKDGVFHRATAEVKGNIVILSSDQVPEPVNVRYGWADNPEVNIYNREGLPAVPFRTDHQE